VRLVEGTLRSPEAEAGTYVGTSLLEGMLGIHRSNPRREFDLRVQQARWTARDELPAAGRRGLLRLRWVRDRHSSGAEDLAERSGSQGLVDLVLDEVETFCPQVVEVDVLGPPAAVKPQPQVRPALHNVVANRHVRGQNLEKRQVHDLNQFGAFGPLAHALTLHGWYC
jgi:hypothetical protein